MDWVEANIPGSATIMAADGQATGYLLRRPTLSMVSSEYSPVRWDCDRIQREMRRFGAAFLILYKPSETVAADPVMNESPFFASALTPAPPCGFTIAVENPGIRILKLVRAQ